MNLFCFLQFAITGFHCIYNQEVEEKVNANGIRLLPGHLVSSGFEILNVGASTQVEFEYFQRMRLSAANIPLWNVHGEDV
ncbi:hypothetical protein T07_7936 [Trichinella nelsoni]|uniref:Uncharacterized protein n=1 Tax=Trichinella nelsoni TaxID=6336 RepID=A0A0V0S273_9BILA|nr:hypothetical protein T07_7936 [Trichinella nelsoni]